jgi:ribonuclease P protein component
MTVWDTVFDFPDKNRLLSASDYKQVFSKPVRTVDKYFTILARVRKTGSDKIDVDEEPRLGLAISKKNTRLAVDRNKLKRVVRESFRHNKEKVCGLDMVVMAKFGAAKADNSVLFESLSKHWKILNTKISMKPE